MRAMWLRTKIAFSQTSLLANVHSCYRFNPSVSNIGRLHLSLSWLPINTDPIKLIHTDTRKTFWLIAFLQCFCLGFDVEIKPVTYTDHFENLNMKEFLWHCWWYDNDFKFKTTIDYRFLPRCKTFSSPSLSELCRSQIINLSRPGQRQLPGSLPVFVSSPSFRSPDIKLDNKHRRLDCQCGNNMSQSRDKRCYWQAASGIIYQASRLKMVEFVLK